MKHYYAIKAFIAAHPWVTVLAVIIFRSVVFGAIKAKPGTKLARFVDTVDAVFPGDLRKIAKAFLDKTDDPVSSDPTPAIDSPDSDDTPATGTNSIHTTGPSPLAGLGSIPPSVRDTKGGKS